MILTQIPPEHKELIPHRAAFDILQAMEYSHGERTFKQVIDAIEAGESQLWLKFSDEHEHIATVVTRVVEFDNKIGCIIEYLGGQKVDTLLSIQDVKAIEDWARWNGCADIRVIGRKAWKKVLKPQGYDEMYTVIGKQL